MRKAALLSLFFLATPVAASAHTPVVVELYTAQGCGVCGDANAFAAKLAERPGVLVLTFPVDYWDYLGWADTFAKPEFADRQKAYVAKLALHEPYTPQVVVDGRVEANGAKVDGVDKLVGDALKARRYPPDIRIRTGGRRADVGSGRAPHGGADVWLIRYDPREQEVTVRSGDNKGQTLVQKNVVRQVMRLGGWKGRAVTFRLPPADDEMLQTVVLVQGVRGGRILATAQSHH